jgi:hypothetical protein
MIQTMEQTSQPGFIASLVSGFGTFTGQHGFAVNLIAVIAMASVGVAFLTGRRAVIRPAAVAFVVLCLADWVLIEDLGFFGGLGTDPNSMIPMALLGVTGYLACTSVPEPSAARSVPARQRWRDVLRPATLRRSAAAVTAGTMASACAIGVLVPGIAPMAAAQATPGASVILAEARPGAAGRTRRRKRQPPLQPALLRPGLRPAGTAG